jgi:hypothetical protein
MRTLIIQRPDNDIRILRLSTGEAVVKMYSGYVEEYVSGSLMVTANMVEVKVVDSPELEAEVLNNWSKYYNMALASEIEYLRGQYRKTVDDLLRTLLPEEKEAVVEKAEEIIRNIAHGDKPFLIRQDLLKLLKQNT